MDEREAVSWIYPALFVCMVVTFVGLMAWIGLWGPGRRDREDEK